VKLGVELGHPQLTWGWLKVVTRNHCLNSIARSKRLKICSNTCLGSLSQTTFVSRKYSQLDLEEQERIVALYFKNCKDTMENKVGRLYYQSGKTLSEVQSLLNLKSNTTLSHLRRVRITLRKFAKINHSHSAM
jgi:DNA-directed RNA polymerase specialized sigma24 family protein